MSYEGFEQLLCENGHYWVVDAYDLSFDLSEKCSVCGAGVAWYNGVDQTNCEEVGYVELELLNEATYCTCQCGHKHQLTPPTYKMPEGIGYKVKR
jgi:hypothetical protein